MAAVARSGLLEIFIKQQWHRVFVTLADDSLILSLDQQGETPALVNGSADGSQVRTEGPQESYHPEHLPESVAGQRELSVLRRKIQMDWVSALKGVVKTKCLYLSVKFSKEWQLTKRKNCMLEMLYYQWMVKTWGKLRTMKLSRRSSELEKLSILKVRVNQWFPFT